MLALDLDPVWVLAYWLVMGVAIVVSGLAILVILADWVRERRRVDPRRSEIRSRLQHLDQGESGDTRESVARPLSVARSRVEARKR